MSESFLCKDNLIERGWINEKLKPGIIFRSELEINTKALFFNYLISS